MMKKFRPFRTSARRGRAASGLNAICRAALAFIAVVPLFLPVLSFSQPLANGYHKFVGNVVHNGNSIRSDFSKYWNQVTPEDDGKWVNVEPVQGTFNWTRLDNIYDYALSKGFPYKHHNLVWGNQQPSWIAGLDSAAQRAAVEEWIDSVGRRYPQMTFVDVVNEPFNGPPSYANALGGSGTTGWDWVITAFQWARQYCAPGVKLLINEYNVLQSNTVTDNYIALIDTLKSRNLVDGIGIQGHYFEFKGSGYSYPISTLKSNLNRIAATGLPIYISEFDINEADDNAQLANYKVYFPLFWENPAVRGMTLWGYTQYETWKTNAYLVTDRNAERPALKWLRTYLAGYLKTAIVLPVDTVGESRNPLLVWHSASAASSYRVQVAADSEFTSVVADTTVSDTLVRLDTLGANTKFFWHVAACNPSDTGDYAGAESFTTGNVITGVRESRSIPAGFELSQNYPNPFNPTTMIGYSVPSLGGRDLVSNSVRDGRLSTSTDVTLKVYDILGREVATLVRGRQSPGYHTVVFDATGLPSGVYFYRIQSGGVEKTRRMLLIK